MLQKRAIKTVVRMNLQRTGSYVSHNFIFIQFLSFSWNSYYRNIGSSLHVRIWVASQRDWQFIKPWWVTCCHIRGRLNLIQPLTIVFAEFLSVQGSMVTGAIPAQISNLTKLGTCDATSFCERANDTSVGGTPSHTYVDFAFAFTEILSIANTQLTGALPSALCVLPTIQSICADKANVTCSCGASICACSEVLAR